MRTCGVTSKKDRKNEEAIQDLAYLLELGEEIRTIFLNRLKKIFLDKSDSLEGGEENILRWNDYRLVSRKVETPKICSFEFEAVSPSKNSFTAMPGSHVRVKLGDPAKAG